MILCYQIVITLLTIIIIVYHHEDDILPFQHKADLRENRFG